MILTLIICGLLFVDAKKRCTEYKVSDVMKDPVENIRYKFNVDLDATNEEGPNVSITFTWKPNKEVQFDALRYSVDSEDPDNEEDWYLNGYFFFDDVEATSSPPENCNSLISGKMRKFTEEEFDVICDSFCHSECKRSICTFREFQPLPEDSEKTHSLTVPATFAKDFTFKLVAYVNLTHSEIVAERATGFCVDELVRNLGMELSEIACRKSFDQRSNYCSGPVVDLHVDYNSLTYGSSGLTANITVKWKRPYDIKAGETITNYAFVKGREEILIKPTEDNDVNFWQERRMTNVLVQERKKVVVRVKCTSGENGFISYSEYEIPDACKANLSIPFCDENANCEMTPEWGVGSICTCLPGYKGNGLNTDLFTGDNHGCRKTCNGTCPNFAECFFSCFCPSALYFGDGSSDGMTCILVLLIMPLLLVFFVIFCAIKRKRKKRVTISKFLDADARETFALKGAKNSNVFGEEYEIDPESLLLQGVIGRGIFGVVSRATLLKKFRDLEEGTQVAVKIAAGAEIESLLLEISLLKSIGEHENILQFIGCSTMLHNSSPVLLVTEYVAYGDLHHFLLEAREPDKRESDPIYCMTEREAYYIGQQVANGMDFLSKMRIIHGDLAARNVLVGENLVCKISDFGLANDVYRYGAIKDAVEKKVPYRWVSPERMMGGKVPITWRSDVWSFGILLYEIVTLGGGLYPGVHTADIVSKLESGYRMERPLNCSDFLYSIMLRCWEWTPSSRPGFRELVNQMKSKSEMKSDIYLQPA